MSPSTSRAPDAAIFFAVARPIPLAPPVMTAVLPSNSIESPFEVLHQLEFLTIDARRTLGGDALGEGHEGTRGGRVRRGHDEGITEITAEAQCRFERDLGEQCHAKFARELLTSARAKIS